MRAARGYAVYLWLCQRVSAVVLLVLVVVHAHAFVGASLCAGVLDYHTLYHKLTMPAWKAAEIAFFLFAVFHGVVGVWLHAGPLVRRRGFRRALAVALCIVGGVAVVYVSACVIAV